METKSFRNCTDAEIHHKLDQVFEEIRNTPLQYGIIRIEMSGGKVKFITVEKSVV